MLKPTLITAGIIYLAGHFYVYHVKPQPTPKQKYVARFLLTKGKRDA